MDRRDYTLHKSLINDLMVEYSLLQTEPMTKESAEKWIEDNEPKLGIK